jgi:hypothetical protein
VESLSAKAPENLGFRAALMGRREFLLRCRWRSGRTWVRTFSAMARLDHVGASKPRAAAMSAGGNWVAFASARYCASGASSSQSSWATSPKDVYVTSWSSRSAP